MKGELINMEEIFSPINGYESRYLISNYGRVYSVNNLTTGEIFESINAAAKVYNTDRHNISNVLKVKQKTACKCQWQYIDKGGDNNDSRE